MTTTCLNIDALELLRKLGDESAALVLTDPPYSERTHSNAKTMDAKRSAQKAISTFSHISEDYLREVLHECARVTNSWIISFMDYAHAFELEKNPPEGLRVMRIGVWVKTNPTPQISGDRPAQGWEAIVYLHRADRRATWNGGGKHGNYITQTIHNGHPTAKPLTICEDIIRKFTNHGELVVDPFAGSGTTLVAAQNTGRRAIGSEINPTYHRQATERLLEPPLIAF